jgi:AcrR family transcriptional regulator
MLPTTSSPSERNTTCTTRAVIGRVRDRLQALVISVGQSRPCRSLACAYDGKVGRRPGSRNADYELTRDAMLAKLRTVLAASGGMRLSLRELAARVDCEPRTLRHYFGDRTDLLQALFEHDHRVGLPALHIVADGELGPVRDSLRRMLEFVRRGFINGGLTDVHIVGLSAGLEQRGLGHSYLAELLEPTLQSLEKRIERHQKQGDLKARNARHAALQLLGSALLVFLHQHALGGKQQRLLDESAFLDDIVDDFLAAHQVPAKLSVKAKPSPKSKQRGNK